MAVVDDLEFINRNTELASLTSWLQRNSAQTSALIVICSPSGFGKSRLTQQLSIRCQREIPTLLFCMVEPDIQVNTGSVRLHDGFFLQRCAEQLSSMADAHIAPWPSLSEFLKSRKWTTVKDKKKADWISEIPSLKSAYKLLFDYASRTFSFGSFSPTKLLASDSHEAVKICTEYTEFVLSANTTALVIRQVQHCDLQSLRTLLDWSQLLPNFDLILEYTSKTGEFEPAHQKLIVRQAGNNRNFHILDIVRLDAGHLEHLIRTNVHSDFCIETDAYLSWDGNLRSIIEMQFRVGIARKITNSEQLQHVLGNLSSTIESHITALPSLHRMVLAICSAHIESIDDRVLAQAVRMIAPATSPLLLKKTIADLIDIHKFLTQTNGSYRIHNETVADALYDLPSFRPLFATAEKALREYYVELVSKVAWDSVGVAAAVRQVFRLCARTKDAVGLLRATDALSAEVSCTQDQSLYVEVVATAIAADPELYAGDHDRLVIWAASLAYDIGNCEQAEHLLSVLREPDAVCLTMRACALQEVGRHDEALQLAAELRANQTQVDVCLAAELIEAIVRGCRGEHDDARRHLNRLIAEPRYANRPLLGYAYRFFEVTEEYTECIEQLNLSIAWFDRFGMERSKAYSQAATAVLIARTGDITSARAMIAEAIRVLSHKVQDRHLLLNNLAAIELLSNTPDFDDCKRLLSEALRYVRDDYSEVTVLSNLSLSYFGLQDYESARECVEKVILILGDHSFASQEIYWPLCFNAAQILLAIGQHERAQEISQLPRKRAGSPRQNRQYWAFRYGDSTDHGDQCRYLASRPHHPLYLSHWLIDLDGLSLLNQEPLQ
jgi:tetratricopeptide (TPR) repeat protein